MSIRLRSPGLIAFVLSSLLLLGAVVAPILRHGDVAVAFGCGMMVMWALVGAAQFMKDGIPGVALASPDEMRAADRMGMVLSIPLLALTALLMLDVGPYVWAGTAAIATAVGIALALRWRRMAPVVRNAVREYKARSGG